MLPLEFFKDSDNSTGDEGRHRDLLRESHRRQSLFGFCPDDQVAHRVYACLGLVALVLGVNVLSVCGCRLMGVLMNSAYHCWCYS